ncbi:MAG TPA: xanthine dehydrogenase family protein molybdopterin-binding subunit [Gammaproteobacteria bacterium]|nr:xanthine dehydrogenase family protein molybdopterin-binding subunit [Gammaproteobacteria bacterium]
MAYTLLGQDFTPPDLQAKVTGKAKYAEDFRAEGMLFCRLLTSTMPHARVKFDATEALKMEGVVAILTADDVPPAQAPAEPILTNEPLFIGDRILAVAARSEELAAEAIERIKVEYEPLPYVIDPLASLFPAGPDARTDGNVVTAQGMKTVKWTAGDFSSAGESTLPMGAAGAEWSFGDVDAGLAAAKYVLDESFVTAALSHHCLEPRSCMAYWQGDKVFIYGSTQSQTAVMPNLARLAGVEPDNVVYIAEFCGGGFGSKINPYPSMGVPIYMAKKTGMPVLLRINRHEEALFGSSRPAFQGRLRMGFRADGRVLAADLSIVQQNGPYSGGGDLGAAAGAITLLYQPLAMRYRGIQVSTNTTPTGAQRGPGQNQIAAAVEPLLDKAAKALNLDPLEIRRINAAGNDAKYDSQQGPVTSAYQREALERGAAAFDWNARKQRSGQQRGSKVRGVGIGQAFHAAGRGGLDGIVRITPDGKLHVHCGVGNLGTYSYAATSRVAPEVLKVRWENVVIARGDSRLGLPFSSPQSGSNTSFTMTRATYAGAMDAVAKLKEIAAGVLGGAADDYDIADETVFAKADRSKSMTYAAAAQRAIELGGKFAGHEVPEDINAVTKSGVAAIAGTGLIGVAKDNIAVTGMVPAIAIGFIEIELDKETGKVDIVDYLGVADCGTVLHPMGLSAQIRSGAVMGFGMGMSERHIYDPQNGLPGNIGMLQAKPASYLDVPSHMQTLAVDINDPQNPVGSKGIGEPVEGCATAAVLAAISDALGGHYFNRAPVLPDMIVNAAAKREQSHKPLQVSTA